MVQAELVIELIKKSPIEVESWVGLAAVCFSLLIVSVVTTSYFRNKYYTTMAVNENKALFTIKHEVLK